MQTNIRNDFNLNFWLTFRATIKLYKIIFIQISKESELLTFREGLI